MPFMVGKVFGGSGFGNDVREIILAIRVFIRNHFRIMEKDKGMR
jgi:ribosome biogenesis protein Nip4